MKAFSGYDAQSPTLSPSPLGGDCMGEEFKRWKTAYTDRSAKIFSGDLVRLHIKYSDGTMTAIIKELLPTRDGRWWGRCNDGVFQIGTLVQPFAIEKVVALDESGERYDFVQKKADAETSDYFAELAKYAIAEWTREGYPKFVAFPGLDAVNYGGAP